MIEYEQMIKKAKELSIWAGDDNETENLVITPKDMKDTILHYLECTFNQVDEFFEDIPNRFGLLKKDFLEKFERYLDEGDN